MKRIRQAVPRTAPRFRSNPVGTGVLATLLLLIALPPTATAQFSVRPAVLEFGQSGERSVIVRNESGETVVFRVYPGDFDQSAAGVHRFLPFGDGPESCEGRLDVFPDRLAVDPGADAAVRIRLEPGARPCWSVVFVEHRPERVEGMARAIERVAVQILSSGLDPTREASVRDVSVSSDPDGTPVVRYTIENRGNAPIRPRGRLEIRSLEGDVVASVRLEPFGVLPGRSRARRVPLPSGLPGGRLLAVPILDFGADHLVGGQGLFDHAQ